MPDSPIHERLRAMLAGRDREVLDDPARLRGFVFDAMAGHRRERNILLTAIAAGAVGELLREELPPEARRARLAHHLQTDFAMTEDASRWAVETLAFALGLVEQVDGPAAGERANGAIKRREAEKAVADAKAALEGRDLDRALDPAARDAEARNKFKTRVEEGRRALERKEYAAAVTLLTRAPALPGSPEIQSMIETATRLRNRRRRIHALVATCVLILGACAYLGTRWLDGRARLADAERLIGEGRFREALNRLKDPWPVRFHGTRFEQLFSLGWNGALAAKFEEEGSWASALMAWDHVVTEANQAGIDGVGRRRDECARRMAELYSDAMSRARGHVEGKRWDRASEACEEALKVKPGDSDGEALKEKVHEARTADAEQQRMVERMWEEMFGSHTMAVWLDDARNVKMELVRIQPGTFLMGGAEGDEQPVRAVTITRPFWMQTTEVTQAQWRVVMGTNPSHWKGDGLPVECVSWEDCREFARKLNEKTRSQVPDRTFGLPTEAEWEYACRAGSTGKWCFGDDASKLGEYAWSAENSGATSHAVGQKKPNAWGLYDMHGNVWETCEDWYEPYPSGAATDPTGASSGWARAVRSGSWSYTSEYTRSANRGYNSPADRDVGLRVVLR